MYRNANHVSFLLFILGKQSLEKEKKKWPTIPQGILPLPCTFMLLLAQQTT